MKETSQKRFHRPSLLQIFAGLLLVALCLSNAALYVDNTNLHSEVETLRTDMNARFSTSTNDVTGIADTVGILQQACTLNVNNSDDFLAFLEKNKESKESGGSGILSYGKQVEPRRIPRWVAKSATALDTYTVRSFKTYDNTDGGRTTYYSDPLQPNDGNYNFTNADGYSIFIDMSKLTTNPYGIFEGDFYIMYDDEPGQDLPHSIWVYIFDEKAHSSYKVRIPFSLFTENAGIKYDGAPFCADGIIQFDFVVDWENKLSDTYACREIGLDMIGDIMVYTRNAYFELPTD